VEKKLSSLSSRLSGNKKACFSLETSAYRKENVSRYENDDDDDVNAISSRCHSRVREESELLLAVIMI
jgi:hypothetical protein